MTLPTKIFLSFTHDELELARSVHNLLERDFGESSVFMSDDIDPGENWMEEIRRAIRSSRVVVLMLSKDSLTRRWINFEAGAARFDKNKKVVSLIYGGLAESKLPKPFVDLQVIDLRKDPAKLSPCIHKQLVKSKPSGVLIGPLPYISRDPLYESIARQLVSLTSKRKRKRKPAQVADSLTLEKRILSFFPRPNVGGSAALIASDLGVPVADVADKLCDMEQRGLVHSSGANWYKGPAPRWGK